MVEGRCCIICQIAREEPEENTADESEHLDKEDQCKIVSHRNLYRRNRDQPEFQAMIEKEPERKSACANAEDALLSCRPFTVKTAQKDRTQYQSAD